MCALVSYKNMCLGYLQMPFRNINTDPCGNWMRINKFIYFINEITDTSNI